MSAGAPLRDIVVVELGHNVAAPFAGEILGDLGATVIKVEKLDGDDARKWAPPYWHGHSALFQSLNRNKLSVVVDLRDAADRGRLERLILERADVVIQNLRPGTAAELGLDAATLRRKKPRLVYCTIGAFGSKGPLKDKPGYDPLLQAFGGFMSVTGEPGRPPVRAGSSIMDIGAGMWSVIGILGALMGRAATGEGATIETSLYETALAWMCYHVANYQASGEVPTPQGSGAAMIVPYRGYETRDGFVMIGAGSDKLFQLLSRALGQPGWAEDPRFLHNPDRVRHKDVLNGLIQDIARTKTTAELVAALEAAGVPCAPLQRIDQVVAHPQTAALGMLQPSPDGSISLLGLPLSFDGERPQFRRMPPTLGQHTEEVLGPYGPPRARKEQAR
jgi:crotonobetainyl-CoA:carnitine CoA-transferase CaiB-like acyl-CoA transferase